MYEQSLKFTLNVDRAMLCCPRCDWEIDADVHGNTVSLIQLGGLGADHLDASPACRD